MTQAWFGIDGAITSSHLVGIPLPSLIGLTFEVTDVIPQILELATLLIGRTLQQCGDLALEALDVGIERSNALLDAAEVIARLVGEFASAGCFLASVLHLVA